MLHILKTYNTRAVGVIAVSLVLILGTWIFVQADGTTISICVKHSGDSYIIGSGFAHQSCNNNEQLLSFNVTGPQGPQGIQGPAGPQGPEGGSAKVYDSNNQLIGYVTHVDGHVGENWSAPYANYNYPFQMLDKQLGVIEYVVEYSASNGAILSASLGNTQAYYISSDCSGQAYVSDLTVMATSFLLGGNGGNNGFAVDRSVSKPDHIDYNSTKSDPILGYCSVESGTINNIFPVRDATPILQSYVWPFHIGL